MAKGVTVKIAHICENYMGHYIYFTPQYYKKVYGKTAEYNCIMFRAKDGYSEEQVKKPEKNPCERSGTDNLLSA